MKIKTITSEEIIFKKDGISHSQFREKKGNIFSDWEMKTVLEKSTHHDLGNTPEHTELGQTVEGASGE